MATNFVIWDRTEKCFVGPSGSTPSLFPTSNAASSAIDRVNKHNGGQAAKKTFDIVSVTVN